MDLYPPGPALNRNLDVRGLAHVQHLERPVRHSIDPAAKAQGVEQQAVLAHPSQPLPISPAVKLSEIRKMRRVGFGARNRSRACQVHKIGLGDRLDSRRSCRHCPAESDSMSLKPRSPLPAATRRASQSPGDVAEVAGPPYTSKEAAACIALGLLALLISGLMGLLLAALADEGRLSASGIGFTAMLEALSTGLVTGAAGILLKPVRLRTIAAVAAGALVLLDLATLRVNGQGVMIVRALAGLPEGVLLWISIGFISRTVTPERWAAVLFTGMGLSQLAVATGLTTLILPRFGANGGYLTVAVGAALAVPTAFFLPRSLGAVVSGPTAGAPPFRGWVALGGTLCMAASLTAVGVYVIPLARQAGLSVLEGRSAISVALACQMAGGALATAIAGRVRYITVFRVCAAVFLATWAAYAIQSPAWLFIGMTGLSGLAAFVAGPFLIPMTVQADPSRRAAMQSGAVQLLAGAFGPLLASFAVTNHNARGVLILAVGLQLTGLAVATALHQTSRWRAAEDAVRLD